jgi:hypothetical protein
MANERFTFNNSGGAATRRLLRIFDAANDEQMSYGLEWYEAAHTFCIGLSERYGISVESAAGIVAALSPRCEWGLNMRMADEVCRTGDTSGLRGNILKAQRILAGEAPLEVLGGNKVRSFFDNIARPRESVAVTIDRHAIDAMLGEVGDDKSRKVLDRVGAYESACSVYRRAAALRGVPAHVMQAVCWVAWRDAKAGGAMAA